MVRRLLQSAVGKKMAAVHFTTIPCEPYTAHKKPGKPYFCDICLRANDIVFAKFEDFRTFLYVFMSVVKIFVT